MWIVVLILFGSGPEMTITASPKASLGDCRQLVRKIVRLPDNDRRHRYVCRPLPETFG